MNSAVELSVLIAAWDEEASVGTVVADALASCRAADVSAECLVCVDRRTTDRTADLAAAAGARIIFQRGRGLTDALLQVASIADGRVCLVLDGDGQHDATAVARLAAPILAGEADLVTGARDARSLHSGFGGGWRGTVRHAGSRLLAHVARLALRRRVPDPLTGMFACRRADLMRLDERVRTAPRGGYKLLLGLLLIVPPGRAVHETVPFRPRCAGASKLGAGVVLATLRQLLQIVLSRRSSTTR